MNHTYHHETVIEIFLFFFFINSISEIEPKYYADGEDAYAMKRDLTGLRLEVCVLLPVIIIIIIIITLFKCQCI